MLPEKIESLWTATTPKTNYPELASGIETDVAIIGAGIAGLNVGYFLQRVGFRVVIIDAQMIATGTSGNTTAKVTSQHSLKYEYLKNKLGMEQARTYAEANQWAIDELEKIITREKIECDFTRLPAYVYAMTEDGFLEIKKEAEAAKEINLPASLLKKIENITFPIIGALKFDNQAYFHPRKYLLAVAEVIQKQGG